MTVSAATDVSEVHLLCLGLGYTARALAARLASRAARITGTATTETGAEAIRAAGWRGMVLAGAPPSADVLGAVADATHVLVSAAPEDAGDPIMRVLGPALADAPRLAWIGYLSTVGVYGDHQGAWVDETTAPRNPDARSRRRLAAEANWLALGRERGLRVEIFRLPGIYGPGRSAVDQLAAGTARRIVKPGQVFNRIHVADIAAGLEVAMTAPRGFDIYNLTDDEPAPADEVVSYAAGLMGIAPPPPVPFAEARLSPMAASFYAETKRVSNWRMTSALGVRLAYPTYREGMAAIWRERSALAAAAPPPGDN